MKTLLLLPPVAFALLAVAPTPAAGPPTEDARVTAFFRASLEAEFRSRPLEATRQGDHRFDHLVDDISPAARKGWAARHRATLADLPRAIAKARLSRDGQIDYEILSHHLTREVWIAENADPFRDDPRAYNDYLTEGVYLLLTQSTLPKAVNVRNAAARMAFLPRVVEAARSSLGNPPRVYTETAIRQNRGAIAFYEKGIYDLAGDTPALSELRPAAERVLPTLRAHQKFLEETVLPRSTGEWRIGKEKFARKLDLELNAGLSADEVLREAEAEFARVERDMYVIARQLWPQGVDNTLGHLRRPSEKEPLALPPDDEEGRRETIRLVLARLNKEHGGVEGLTADARNTVDRIKKFIRANDILSLPEPDRCRVIEMPEFQRGFSVAYLNPAPPLDPKASSYYAISPPPADWDARRVESFLQEYNRDMLAILTVHEGYPGHYVQLEYSNRHPSLIRRVLSSGVFAEGWAVYTEQMMLDQGFARGGVRLLPVPGFGGNVREKRVEGVSEGAALRLHQLKWYLRTVANAILDHKMHCTAMTDEQAMAFLMKRAFQSEGEALGKVTRAKLSSCQLSTYFVGRTAFYRLRQTVQRERGDRFSLGRYHEAVLDHGTLPVKYLPELVRKRLERPR